MAANHPNRNVLPAGPGRPPGSKNKITLIAQRNCRNILESDEYKASILRRIVADNLAPAVEVMFHHYAYGKPKDTVEVLRSDASAAETMNAEQLAHEAQRTALEILELKSQAEAQRREEEEQAERDSLIAQEQERLAAEYRAQAAEREREAQKLAEELERNGAPFYPPDSDAGHDDHVS
jgi:hypothetical protein